MESVQQVDEEEYEEKVKRPAPKVRMLFFMSLSLQRADQSQLHGSDSNQAVHAYLAVHTSVMV